MPRTNHGRGHALGGGVVAGAIGGAALALVLLAAALVQQRDLWTVMKGAAAPFLGERATAPGFELGAVVLGVLAHFAVSIVWGVLFAAIAHGLSRGLTVVAGALWGIVVWFGMYYLVLPLVGLPQVAEATPLGMAILSHVIFGLAVGIGFLPFQRTRPHATPPGTPVPAAE
jgi:hypothetical protein